MRTELAESSDDDLRSMIDAADIVALLPALAKATGDLSVLREDLAPPPSAEHQANGGMSTLQVSRAHEVAFDALRRMRDSPPTGVAPAKPQDDSLQKMLAFMVGADRSEFLPLLQEEICGGDGTDLRAPAWTLDSAAPGRSLTAAVIGAGMSGLLAAYRLRTIGVQVVVLEKNPDVGGTWYENSYPGCRVDVPSRMYAYSFAQDYPWQDRFCRQPDLLEYYRDCAGSTKVADVVRFSCEVQSCTWSEPQAHWTLTLAGPDGPEAVDVDIVVSSVGQLNQPRVPAIPGLDEFNGVKFHSASWPEGFDLAGRRVAVIGSGASACQIVPAIADVAVQVTVLWRTPAWLLPTPGYEAPVSPREQQLYRLLPEYGRWHRFWFSGWSTEGLLPEAVIDPAWREPGSVSAANQRLRRALERYLAQQCDGDEALLRAVRPAYPPAAKRMVRDDGSWIAALRRPDVELIDVGIERVTPTGIRTVDGVEYPVDVIVLATGFSASAFLNPMTVLGVDGRDIRAAWGNDPRAYLGIVAPGAPNFFMTYGPNTNIVVNGAISYFVECQVHYVTECIRLLAERSWRWLDCREELFDRYNTEIDDANACLAWSLTDVSNWYRSASGRVTQNWPLPLIEYWRRTRFVDEAGFRHG